MTEPNKKIEKRPGSIGSELWTEWGNLNQRYQDIRNPITEEEKVQYNKVCERMATTDRTPKGSFRYNGNIVQQHINAPVAIESLIEATKPDRVIEVGTAWGGLTMIIRDILDNSGLESTSLRTYDIEKKTGAFDRNERITFSVENIFKIETVGVKKGAMENVGGTYSLECETVRKYLQDPGVVIAFVDGGNKAAEFNALAKWLKKGDVMLTHDYIDTTENFLDNYKHSIWHWQEIKFSDIENAVTTNGLEKYMDETMQPVV